MVHHIVGVLIQDGHHHVIITTLKGAQKGPFLSSIVISVGKPGDYKLEDGQFFVPKSKG